MRAAFFIMAVILCFHGISADKEFIKRIEAKMKTIIIPELKADDIMEAIEAFRELARSHDPDKMGYSIIYRVADNAAPVTGVQPAVDTDDPFGDPVTEKKAPEVKRPPNHKFKYHYKKMNALALIKQFAKDAGLRFKIGSNALILADLSVQIDDMVTRFYLLDNVDIEEGLKKFLESKGVQFNAGSQVAYLSKLNRLVLTNTEEAQDKVLEILNPLMVEKAMKLIIPRFKQSTVDLHEVIKALIEEVKKQDDTLNVRFKYNKPKRVTVEEKKPNSDVEDPFGDDPFGDPAEPGAGLAVNKKVYNFDFENMPVGEIIRYICISANLKYRVEGRTVVISEPVVTDEFTLKLYKAYNDDMRKDPQKFLTENGIKFEAGSAAAWSQVKARILVTAREDIHRRIQEVINQYFEEEILLKKSRKLIVQKRLKEAGQLLKLILKDNPFNNQAVKAFIKLKKNPDYERIKIYQEYPQLLKVTIPKVRFKDENLKNVIAILKKKSKELDKNNIGLNIVLDVKEDEPAEEDPSDSFIDASDPFGDVPVSNERLINLDADNMPLNEVIRYVCDQVGLQYSVNGNIVIFVPKCFILFR